MNHAIRLLLLILAIAVAPTAVAKPRDVSSLWKQDVHRAAEAAVSLAEEGGRMTAAIVRKGLIVLLGGAFRRLTYSTGCPIWL